MGGGSSYLAMLCIAGFLGAIWSASKVSKALGVSDIVLVITTGVVFGPDILGVISKEYTVCEQKRHVECEDPELAYKVANKLPLGEALGRISHMDYCHIADYQHGDAHGDAHGAANGAVGADHATGAAVDSHAADSHGATTVDLHAADSHGATTVDNGTTVDSHAADSHGATTVDSHAADSHGATTASPDAHHRRLSGGGSYTSYEECLEKSCEADIRHECQLTPDVFTLIGHAGVALMIFESGMHFDFEKAKVVGPWACVVAVVGTILPLVAGTALTVVYGKPFFPQGIAAGTALAPTSVGIALRLLGEANVLQENFGQAIITAAFVDDILSLVLFNVLFALGGEFDFVPVVVFPIVGIVFMAIAMYAAMAFWPKFIDGYLLPKIPVKEGAKVPATDEVLFLLMIVVLLTYAFITYLLGTHLWGCFIAGMSFACLSPAHHSHHVWVKQTKRMTSWMIRIFFACTVAFSIPIAKLMSFEAFWKGSIMGIGPCILTKVCCAPFMGKEKWVIGWAMVGRAEFAYLIAQMALAGNMLDEDMFAIVIWALLYATIFAPFVFRIVLNRYLAREGMQDSAPQQSRQEFEDEYSQDGQSERGQDANGTDLDYQSRMRDLEDIKVSQVEGRASSSSKQPGGRCFGLV